MSINNSNHIKQPERKKMINRFRALYKELDILIEALYSPSRYTSEEYTELSRCYRLLQTEADELEENLYLYFSHKNLFFKLRWFKSNPHDGRVASQFIENPFFHWNEAEAQKALDEQERKEDNCITEKNE